MYIVYCHFSVANDSGVFIIESCISSGHLHPSMTVYAYLITYMYVHVVRMLTLWKCVLCVQLHVECVCLLAFLFYVAE